MPLKSTVSPQSRLVSRSLSDCEFRDVKIDFKYRISRIEKQGVPDQTKGFQRNDLFFEERTIIASCMRRTGISRIDRFGLKKCANCGFFLRYNERICGFQKIQRIMD